MSREGYVAAGEARQLKIVYTSVIALVVFVNVEVWLVGGIDTRVDA